METELKLKLAEDGMARMRRHPLLADLALDAPVEHQLVDTYFDTGKLDLWHNGLTLRVRQDGDTWIQTVKTATQGSSALHERGEWESTLAGPAPNPGAIARQIDTQRIADLLSAPGIVPQLHAVFSNTTRRTQWKLLLPDGQQVECALDDGDIHVDGRDTRITELELELKRGEPTQLFELALALHEDIPLQVANDSKAARGYALLDTAPPRPVRAEPVTLTKKMSMEDALRSMGLNCLHQMESNVPGVLKQGVEGLHQMRVGLRRLRALLNMFEELAPLPAPIQESVDWLAGELGATRDWDVLAGTTIPAIKGPDLTALRGLAEERAHVLHRKMLQTLHHPRYTEVVLQLNGWFYGRQWRPASELRKGSPLAQRARDAMEPLLRKAEKRLCKRIDALDEDNPDARHRVRIAAKKARYAAEFFRELLPGKQVKQYIRSLSGLQDKLGHLNDMAVAERLLGELEEREHAPHASYARGYVTATSETESHYLRAALNAVARLKITA